MASRQLRCPKCANRMEEGFIVDVSQAAHLQSQWVQGKPEKSFWAGLKMKGRSRRLVTTFCRQAILSVQSKPRAAALLIALIAAFPL